MPIDWRFISVDWNGYSVGLVERPARRCSTARQVITGAGVCPTLGTHVNAAGEGLVEDQFHHRAVHLTQPEAAVTHSALLPQPAAGRMPTRVLGHQGLGPPPGEP